jgi:ELWxxDGT repeat protein
MRLLFISALTFFVSSLSLAQISVVKDINTKPADVVTFSSCNCGAFSVLTIYTEEGNTFWKLNNDTQSIERMSLGIHNSSKMGEIMACVNGKFMFAGNDGSQTELWVSDGTPSGTKLLKDLNEGPLGSYISISAVHNESLYFVSQSFQAGTYLWVSDGSEEGTRLIAQVSDKWVSVQQLGVYEHGLFFSIQNADQQYELWCTNGSDDLHLIHTSPWLYELHGLEGKIFFAENVGNVNSLWASDGTDAGTVRIKQFSSAFLSSLVPFEKKLFFSINEIIYSTDGTAENVVEVTTGRMMASGSFKGKFHAVARNGTGNFLFSSDGTLGGTQVVAGLGTGVLYIYGQLPVVNNKLLLGIADDLAGPEPAVSDGTAAGTHLLKAITPESVPTLTMVFHTLTSELSLFLANDGEHGTEVWITDASTGGTRLLVDAAPGTQSATNIFNLELVNNNLLFLADSERQGPLNLWQSDGTESGTKQIYDFQSYVSPYAITRSPDGYWFFDNGRLLKTDGTIGGMKVV